MHYSARWSAAAGAVAVILLGLGPVTTADAAGVASAPARTGAHVGPHSKAAAGVGAASSYRPHLLADGNVASPPWWHGTCDAGRGGAFPGSYHLGANWDGLVACGPGSNEGAKTQPVVRFFRGAWGEYEWQCVELSMRWMYLAWGVPPYGANGNSIADNYAAANPNGPALSVVKNGTKGFAPQPGDVLEMTDGDAYGHTEVVTGSYVNARGDGHIEAITENLSSPTTGWDEMPVRNWVVNGGFGKVVDWLHNPHFALSEPVLSELGPDGTLSVKLDNLHGAFTPVAHDVANAEVIGAGGAEPAPILVILTTSGELEAGWDLPGAPMWLLASGVRQLAAASSQGRAGAPVIGWVTTSGQFYLLEGGFGATPVLEASGVASIAIGSNSPGTHPLVGYVTPAGRAFVKVGAGGFVHLASGVRTLLLADGGSNRTDSVQGYVGVAGRAYLRQGLSGRFHQIAGPAPGTPVKGAPGDVTSLDLATVGSAATPLVGYVTASGQAFALYGNAAPLLEYEGAQAVAVAGAPNVGAFPIFAVEDTRGSWYAKDGSLAGGYVREGAAAALGLSALVVS